MSLPPLARFVRAHLAATLVVTCITAWFSYAIFHNDEYFQILELTRWKLAPAEVPIFAWEQNERLRPWLQPFLYWVVGRSLWALGVRDIFQLAFVFRLLTGLACVATLRLFLGTTLPWQKTDESKRLHVRVVTLLGFLPYLFVRTSSETGSMIAATAAWSLLLRGAVNDEGKWKIAGDRSRWLAVGLLFGFAFEMRFQTALIALGTIAWVWKMGDRRRELYGALMLGGAIALGLGVLVDRWGYGTWTFPAWTYFRVNILEGAASSFGKSLPFAYLWLLPANIFFPVIVVLMILGALAWWRCPMHPITWATLPFVLVHNLIAHKEERFLFPLAIFSTAFVTMALSNVRWSWPNKLLVGWSFAMMTLLALFPIGWHHNVRFTRFLHDRFGDEVHAAASPGLDIFLPAFHPRVYDVGYDRVSEWLITDAEEDVPNAQLVYSELPDWARGPTMRRFIERYNASLGGTLRPLHYRALYRTSSSPSL